MCKLILKDNSTPALTVKTINEINSIFNKLGANIIKLDPFIADDEAK